MKGLRGIVKKVVQAHTKYFDTVFIISGMEGMGKSNLALIMQDYYWELTKQSPDIECIALDQQQFINAIQHSPKDIGCIVFDEAGDGLLSRDAMGETNKDMVKMFMVIRAKGLFTILVLPSFWYLDKYFREHRVKGLFHVYSRGKYAFWDRKKILKIIRNGEQYHNIFCERPSFFERFSRYDGELINSYQEKKNYKINSMITSMDNKYSGGLTITEEKIIEGVEQGLTYAEIGKNIMSHEKTVGKMVRKLVNSGKIVI